MGCAMRWGFGAAADRGQQGHFIALGEGVGSGRVFAVDGDGDRGPERGVTGIAVLDAAAVEEVTHGRAGGQVDGLRGVAEKVAKNAEGEQSNAHEKNSIEDWPRGWTHSGGVWKALSIVLAFRF